MLVEIGHEAAMDATEKAGVLHYRTVEGQRTTTFRVPEGYSITDAFVSIRDALPHHIQPGEPVAWIKSDNPTLQGLLMTHFGITARSNIRPLDWGQQEGT